MHVAEQGDGPAVVFVHGFPELWYSWRRQLPALAAAGLRAIAPGHARLRRHQRAPQRRGLRPPPRLRRPGHPARCAVVGAGRLRGPTTGAARSSGRWRCTTRSGCGPSRGSTRPTGASRRRRCWRWSRAAPACGTTSSTSRSPASLRPSWRPTPSARCPLLLRSSDPADRIDALRGTLSVRERGGMLVGLPERPARSIMLSAEDLAVFVEAFRATGFRGPLNWYRNDRRNWSGARRARRRASPARR